MCDVASGIGGHLDINFRLHVVDIIYHKSCILKLTVVLHLISTTSSLVFITLVNISCVNSIKMP